MSDARLSLSGAALDVTLAASGERPSSPSGALAPGAVIHGTFQIEERIGAGGMGVVYRALDLTLDRPLALKIQRVEEQPDGTARLLREARAMARLS
ncbi:MAG: hypothetical protein KC636_37160, partial [Myxococcales bacterium]|nr:hypothetical protein [Myxococcales bacterium]